MLSTFFHQLGLAENEQKVFLALNKLGVQPASVIARNTDIERTTVYKILLRLVEMGIIRKTQKNKVMHFHIPNSDVLKSYIQRQKNAYTDLESKYGLIRQELEKQKMGQHSYLPKITIFDGKEGLKNLYDDILYQIYNEDFISIKMFASNVFDEQIKTDPKLKDLMMDFFQNIKNTDIVIDSFLGNGVLLMESVSKTSANMDFLNNLPAGNSSINIFLVGKIFYLVIFRDTPFGIKIENEEIVQTMHFMMEQLKVN